MRSYHCEGAATIVSGWHSGASAGPTRSPAGTWGWSVSRGNVFEVLRVEGAVIQLPLLLMLLLGQSLGVGPGRVVDERVLQESAEHKGDTDLEAGKKETNFNIFWHKSILLAIIAMQGLRAVSREAEKYSHIININHLN